MAGLSASCPRNAICASCSSRPSRRHLRPGRRRRPGQGAGAARGHARRHAGHPHRGRPARPAPANHLVALAPPGAMRRRSAWPGSSCPRASSRPPTCPRPRWPMSWAGWPRRSASVAETTMPTPRSADAARAAAPSRSAADAAGPTGPSTRLGPRRPAKHFGVTPWPASASTTTSRAWPPPARCCCTCRKRSRPSLAHLSRLRPLRRATTSCSSTR